MNYRNFDIFEEIHFKNKSYKSVWDCIPSIRFISSVYGISWFRHFHLGTQMWLQWITILDHLWGHDHLWARDCPWTFHILFFLVSLILFCCNSLPLVAHKSDLQRYKINKTDNRKFHKNDADELVHGFYLFLFFFFRLRLFSFFLSINIAEHFLSLIFTRIPQ